MLTKDINNYDAIIVGSGFSGSTVARQLADNGYKVLIIEKREHIGGNMYDFEYKGTYVQKYGPHIIHYDDENVHKFLNRFSKFNKYKHRVYASVDNELFPLPININSFKKLLINFNQDDVNKFLNDNIGKLITISQLKDINEEYWKVVYTNVFENYSIKMWGCHPNELYKFVLSRIPITFSDKDTHFRNKYECIPKYGFTKLFENILDHPNIDIVLNENFIKYISFKDGSTYINNEKWNKPIVYTGSIDELFSYKHGQLKYRSLNFVINEVDKSLAQTIPTINYPQDRSKTRTTNFNILYDKLNQPLNILMSEYPTDFNGEGERLYPMPNKTQRRIFDQYKKLSSQYNNLFLLGRLANYQYIDMDKSIIYALECSKKVLAYLSEWFK